MVQKPFGLSVLGGLRLVDCECKPVEPVIAQAKRAAVVTYLRLAAVKGPEQREKLLAVFWPELSAVAARNSLNQAIHFLRRTLGPDCIVTAADQSISIDPSLIRCDASDFEQLVNEGRDAEAVKLYAGPFLDAFHVHQVPQFTQWAEYERERLQSLYLQTVERLARKADAERNTETATDLWRKAATAAPLDTRYAVGYIRALSNANRRADALRHVEIHRRLFRAELDSEPDGELTALETELRTNPKPAAPSSLVPAVATRADDVETKVSGDLPQQNPSRRRSGAVILTAGGFALVLTLTALMRANARVKSGALPGERILVAALANKTGDTALNDLGGLAADYVSDGLLRSGVVEVVDPATAFYAVRNGKGASLDLSSPGTRLDVARSVNAGTVVWGTIYKAGDSLLYDTRVTDIASGDVIGAVRVPAPLGQSPTVAVKELEQKLGGLIASRFDINLNTVGATRLPAPRLDAYREYSKGLQYFQRGENDDAFRAFVNARSADSTFFLPLVWAWYAAANAYHFTVQDSLIEATRKFRDRLSPLDRYAFDAHAAKTASEERAATAAAEKLAPGSNWSYMLGSQELAALHTHAAIKALSKIDRSRGWARGWLAVDETLMAALHVAGDYQAELAIADEAIARADSDRNRSSQQLEAARVLALSGMNDDAALRKGISRLIVTSGNPTADIWGLEDLDMALLYHGRRSEADEVAKYVEAAARKLVSDGDAVTYRALVAEQAYLRWDLRRAKALAAYSLARDSAERIFSDPGVPRILAVIAAIENKPATVDSLIEFVRVGTQDSGYPAYISATDSARQVIWNRHNRHLQFVTYIQACVAAVRGDAATATRLLREAIDNGMQRAFSVMMDPCFKPINPTNEYRALFGG